jgi:hypothetical protein
MLELRKAEAELFGESGLRAQRSSLVIRVSSRNAIGRAEIPPPNCAPVELKTSANPRWINPISYLGFGPYAFREARTQTTASFFAPGQFMSVRVLDRRGLSEERRSQFFLALWGLTTLGCIGHRQHNAFGSVRIIDRSVFHNELGENFLTELPSREALQSLPKTGPLCEEASFPIWTANARVMMLREHNTFTEALAELGQATIEARAAVGSKENRSVLGLPIIRGPQGRQPSPINRRVCELAPDRFVPVLCALPHASGHPEALEIVQRYMDALPASTPIFP